MDDSDGDRVSEGEREALYGSGLDLSLADAMPDVLLWNRKTDALWIIEAVTSDGEVDHHKVEQVRAFAERNGESTVGFTTAYPTWKVAAQRQGRHKNIARDLHLDPRGRGQALPRGVLRGLGERLVRDGVDAVLGGERLADALAHRLERVEVGVADAPQVGRVDLRVPVELPEVPIDERSVQVGREPPREPLGQAATVRVEVVDVVLDAELGNVSGEARGVAHDGDDTAALLLRGEALGQDVGP